MLLWVKQKKVKQAHALHLEHRHGPYHHAANDHSTILTISQYLCFSSGFSSQQSPPRSAPLSCCHHCGVSCFFQITSSILMVRLCVPATFCDLHDRDFVPSWDFLQKFTCSWPNKLTKFCWNVEASQGGFFLQSLWKWWWILEAVLSTRGEASGPSMCWEKA